MRQVHHRRRVFGKGARREKAERDLQHAVAEVHGEVRGVQLHKIARQGDHHARRSHEKIAGDVRALQADCFRQGACVGAREQIPQRVQRKKQSELRFRQRQLGLHAGNRRPLDIFRKAEDEIT